MALLVYDGGCLAAFECNVGLLLWLHEARRETHIY